MAAQETESTSNWSQGELLIERRDVVLPVSVLTGLALVPFVGLQLAHGRFALAALIGVALLSVASNVPALLRGARPPVSLTLVAVTLVVAVIGSVVMQGMNGVPWAYPTLLSLSFIVDRWRARVLGTTLVVGSSVATFWCVEPAFGVRVAITLLLQWVMIEIVLNVLSTLQGVLTTQAITDPLTGAFNRRHLEARLRRISQATASAKLSNAVLAIDLDHFKSINDDFGHEVGDLVLKRVTEVIRASIRKSDALYRTGGEEFCLILESTTVEVARRVAEQLCKAVSGCEIIAGRRVTLSIGVSFGWPSFETDEWLVQADRALYEAKRLGRDRVVIFDGLQRGTVC